MWPHETSCETQTDGAAGAESRQNLAGLAENPAATCEGRLRGTSWGLPRPQPLSLFPELSTSAVTPHQQKPARGELGAHRGAGVPFLCRWSLKREGSFRNGAAGCVCPALLFVLEKMGVVPQNCWGEGGAVGQGEQWELLPPACDPVWGIAYVL